VKSANRRGSPNRNRVLENRRGAIKTMNAKKKEIGPTAGGEPPPRFEEALERLEKIVAEMEQGELPLEISMKKFEEGMKLARFCTRALGDTEKKIEVLLKQSPEPEWQPCDIGEPAGENPEVDFELE